MTDRLIRITTALAVVAVARVAAIISYQHGYELVRSHGESGVTARLLPFTVDGLIWAASMVVPPTMVRAGLAGTRRPGHGAVPHGAGPVREERLDQRAGPRLPHHGHHDPGGHHPLLPGHGHAHPHRGQDRRHDRPPSGVRHRTDHLRLRLGADRAVPW